VSDPVYIWIRHTLDWKGGEPVLARFQPRVDLWNATFETSYHEFRHRLREIARLNHSRVEGAVCAGWEEIPIGALVLPVDDDDWFSPDAGAVLRRELDPRIAGYRWPSSWIEPPRGIGPRFFGRRLLPGSAPTYTCTTNNYALVKEEGVRTPLLLTHHLLASQWFDRMTEDGASATPKTIERRLSVANRTLASQTSLRFRKASMSRSQLLRKLRRYRRLYERPPPEGLEWCGPYLELMSELMAELRISARG
jgi:hypothetical protein